MIELIKVDEIYNRILDGKPYCKKLKPYSNLLLERVISMLEYEQEFEKCIIISDLILSRKHENGFIKR